MAHAQLRLNNEDSIQQFIPTNKTLSFIKLARRQAISSSYGIFRHGAVLVNGGKVINVGFNQERFTCFGKRFRPSGVGSATLHAELSAILNLDYTLTKGGTIYVVRCSIKDNEFRNSKPCAMCHSAMKFVGIKRVVYSIENGFMTYKL